MNYENNLTPLDLVSVKVPTFKKKKWVGALLNFFAPGLGQIYARKPGKGFIVFVSFLIILFSLRLVAFNFPMLVSWLTLTVGFELCVAVIGYRDVDATREWPSAPYDKAYVYAPLLLCWILFVSVRGRAFDTITPINFASIPTPAMDPALQVGDQIAFEKSGSPKRNEVTLFWFPDDIKTMYIKRCVGMPGDTLEIRNKNVFIDGHPQPARVPLKFEYLVTTDGSELSSRALKNNGIPDGEYYQVSVDTYTFFLTDSQVQKLKAIPVIKEIQSFSGGGEYLPKVYPNSENFPWSTDNYGPLYIPRKGDKIAMTKKTIDLYIKCIKSENGDVRRDSSGLFIKGQLTKTYEFKDNYFFMMGDSRHNSLDSRYWGLLPQKLVIGTALYSYWGKTRDRIGKKIM